MILPAFSYQNDGENSKSLPKREKLLRKPHIMRISKHHLLRIWKLISNYSSASIKSLLMEDPQ